MPSGLFPTFLSCGGGTPTHTPPPPRPGKKRWREQPPPRPEGRRRRKPGPGSSEPEAACLPLPALPRAPPAIPSAPHPAGRKDHWRTGSRGEWVDVPSSLPGLSDTALGIGHTWGVQETWWASVSSAVKWVVAPPPQDYPEDEGALRVKCVPGCNHRAKGSKNGDLETSQGLPSDSLPSAPGIARGGGTVPPVGPKSWAWDAAVVYEPARLRAGWYLGCQVGGWRGRGGSGPWDKAAVPLPVWLAVNLHDAIPVPHACPACHLPSDSPPSAAAAAEGPAGSGFLDQPDQAFPV